MSVSYQTRGSPDHKGHVAWVFSIRHFINDAWGNTYDHNLNIIQAVQNFAARIVSKTIKDLQWLPVIQHLFYRF